MRRSQHLIAAAVIVALSGALAGCTGGMSSFDPSDLLDFLDTKKKLPGERKPVFPQGVPGLEQGVPKDLYKGAAQQQDAPSIAAVQPVEEPKPKNAAKSKGRSKQTASTAPAPAAAPDGEAAAEEEGSTAAAPPAPKPKKIVRRRTTAPPPDPAAPQAGQQPAAQPQQSASPFPAPMPSGTFQR
jgi:pyruvate/2-oxoglutarate dehydrogenase complex dihydrolipoamide acyltransferase (E2) component